MRSLRQRLAEFGASLERMEETGRLRFMDVSKAYEAQVRFRRHSLKVFSYPPLVAG